MDFQKHLRMMDWSQLGDLFSMKKRVSSIRFCLTCMKVTVWEYIFLITHSRCSECGSSYSRFPSKIDKGFYSALNKLPVELRSKYQ